MQLLRINFNFRLFKSVLIPSDDLTHTQTDTQTHTKGVRDSGSAKLDPVSTTTKNNNNNNTLRKQEDLSICPIHLSETTTREIPQFVQGGGFPVAVPVAVAVAVAATN